VDKGRGNMKTNISQLILEDREKRYNNILDISRKYDLPVVCGKLNYPGKDKNTIEAYRGFEILLKIIKEKFSMETVFSKELKGFDGRSILAAVDMTPEAIKKITVEIEDNSELGRIFDIDVYLNDGNSIGRDMINKPQRKCIICDEDARICVRSGKHDLNQIINRINEIINNYGGQYGN
jgi:holo-ACP synthase